MSGAVHLRREGDHVAVLEIDNPPRNPLGFAMRAMLRERLQELETDLTVRSVVLTGRGPAFCSGDDLREGLEAASGEAEPAANLFDFGRVLVQIEAFRVPVIAAVNGWCVGGGVELALACDLRVASHAARFVCAGVNVGLAASAYRLPRLIGKANAKHMLYTGLPYDGHEALRFGLVNELHPPDELMPAALRLAERIATRAPLSVEASKRLANKAADLTPDEAAAAQLAELQVLVGTNDHLSAVTAFFEKREPEFTRS
jgi:enoyl-CoA hydratase